MAKLRKKASWVLAPSDATAANKSLADEILTGTADQTVINARMVTYQKVEILKGNVNNTGPIQIIGPNGTDGPTFELRTAGKFSTIINVATNINGIELTGDPTVWIDGLDLRIAGTGHGIFCTAETASATYRGFWNSHFKDVYIRGDFSTHTGFVFYLNGPFRSTFENIEALGVGNGLYLTANNSAFNPGNCLFDRVFMDIYAPSGRGFVFYTPDAGGQFNICKFIQTEAICSATTPNSSSVGMEFRGSATSYFSTKNISVDSTNIEQFYTGLKFSHSLSNVIKINYLEVANGGTMASFSSDSSNNQVEILSTYVAPGRSITFVNDANTSQLLPNVITGAEGYVDTGATVANSFSTSTVFNPYGRGLSGPGTIAPALQQIHFKDVSLFQATTSRTVVNTTTPSTTLPTGIGSLTIPAGSSRPGTVYELKVWGTYQTPLNPGGVQVDIKLGSTILATAIVNATILATSSVFKEVYGEAYITVYTTGATGTVVCNGQLTFEIASGVTVVPFSTANTNALALATKTVNFNTSLPVDVVQTWTNAQAQQGTTIMQTSLKALNLA